MITTTHNDSENPNNQETVHESQDSHPNLDLAHHHLEEARRLLLEHGLPVKFYGSAIGITTQLVRDVAPTFIARIDDYDTGEHLLDEVSAAFGGIKAVTNCLDGVANGIDQLVAFNADDARDPGARFEACRHDYCLW